MARKKRQFKAGNSVIVLGIIVMLLVTGASLITLGNVHLPVTDNEPGGTPPFPVSEVSFCQDSDSGIEIYSLGIINYATPGSEYKSTSDYCLENAESSGQLREFYCEGSTLNSIYVDCSDYGMECIDGICV